MRVRFGENLHGNRKIARDKAECYVSANFKSMGLLINRRDLPSLSPSGYYRTI